MKIWPIKKQQLFKILLAVSFTALFSFAVPLAIHAQNINSGTGINGGMIGPELAFFDRGNQESICRNVIKANNFNGTIAVMNNVAEDPYNPCPSPGVNLRLVRITHKTTPDQMYTYGRKLKNSGSMFPNGTRVIVGVELNNLDEEFYDGVGMNERQAGAEYALLFNAFGAAMQGSSFKIYPAPPDLYQGNPAYRADDWITGFLSQVNCSYIQGLTGDIFAVPDNSGINAYQSYVDRIRSRCPQAPSVDYFEGWGINPNNNPSIQAQIDWYLTTPLPAGVSSAATLVKNTCSPSTGVNDQWLFYVMGKVYRADGSQIDPATCGNVNPLTAPPTQPAGPKPDPYVNCGDTEPTPPLDRGIDGLGNTEYHSLRPYQSSPCDRRQTEETALYCGNALIVRKTYRVNPSDALSCTGNPDGSQTCNYLYDNAANLSTVTVNLSNAYLPIMGNTENVPNEYNNGHPKTPTVSESQSVNNYVSWFNHGAIQTAEEQPSPQVNTNIDAGINKLINLSGPLRKLLPHYIQTIERLKTIYSVDQNLPQSDIVGSIIQNLQSIHKHHNQVIGCTQDGQIVPCSTTEFYGGKQAEIRLSDFTRGNPGFVRGNPLLGIDDQWGANFPPIEEMFANTSDYFAAYKAWERKSPWPQLFQMIPFSSTEDRLGQTYLPQINGDIVPQSTSPDLKVTNLQFQPNPNLNHKLYFAHMEEDNDTATLLQKLYATKDADLVSGPPIDHTLPEFCEIADTRTNPGDNLWGNYNQPSTSPISSNPDSTITGNMSYRTEFTCVFPPPTVTNSIDQNCINLGNPVDQCITTTTTPPPPCIRVVGIGLAVTTTTPKIDDIWQRLVNGNYGVFKKIYPKIGPDAPITTISDIPASTKVSYAASGENTEVLAGNPNNNRSGSQAQLFFPHIGGIFDHFLKDIQKALRPFGIGNTPAEGQPIPALPPAPTPPPGIACPTSISNINITPPAGNCKLNCPYVPDSAIDPKYLGAIKENTRSLAYFYSKSQTHPGIDQCYNYVVKESLAAGINPVFTLTIWAQESAASDYDRFGCSVQDFGINDPSIASNLQAQLARLLRLPSYYPITYPQCFTNGCSFANYALIYQQGVPSQGQCVPNDRSNLYAQKLITNLSKIAPGCTIAYPTDMNCP
jgi:hypothetical protein